MSVVVGLINFILYEGEFLGKIIREDLINATQEKKKKVQWICDPEANTGSLKSLDF